MAEEKLVRECFDKFNLANHEFEYDDHELKYQGRTHTWDRLVHLATDPKAASGDKSKHLAALTAFVKFREHVVYGIMDILCQGTDIWYSASGSSNVTSDLDLSLVGTAGRPRVMRQFYVKFAELFRHPPGEVFDTNLYVPTFTLVTPTQFERLGKAQRNFNWKIVKPTNDIERKQSDMLYILTSRHEECDERFRKLQRKLALIDLMRYLPPLGRSLILSRVQERSLRVDVNAAFDKYRELEESSRNLNQAQRDEIYLKQAEKVGDIDRLMFTKELDDDGVYQWDQAMSELDLLSTEGLSSQSALKVVVLVGQRGYKLDVSRDAYIDSAIVNAANLLKTLAKHDSDTCEQALVVASKYLSRVFYALEHTGMFGSEIHQKFLATDKVRTTVRGKTNVSHAQYLGAAIQVAESLQENHCDVDLLQDRVVNLLLSTLDMNYALFDQCAAKQVSKQHTLARLASQTRALGVGGEGPTQRRGGVSLPKRRGSRKRRGVWKGTSPKPTKKSWTKYLPGSGGR